MPVVRGDGPRLSSANAARKRIVRTSAIPTVPATFQCTFSNVTQKNVAKKKKSATRVLATTRGAAAAIAVTRGSAGGRRAPRRGSPRESFSRHSSDSGGASSRPSRQRACRSTSAARMPSTSSGATTIACTRVAQQLRGRAVGRHDGEDRALGGDVLEDLAGEHAAAAAAGLGDEQEQHLALALELERAPARDVVDELDAVGEAEARHELAVARAEVADEADGDVLEARVGERLEERLRVALAEERAGVRDAEAVGAGVLEPGEVVEVAAVRDRQHRPSRVEERGPRPRSRPTPRRSRPPCGRRARATPRAARSFTRTAARSARRCGCAPSESRRSATHFAPVARLHRRADEVDRARRRRRQDDVDALGAARWRSPWGSRSRSTSRSRRGRAAAGRRVDARRTARSTPERPCSSSARRRPRGPT